MLSFVDNHDVTRVASILTNEKHLPLIYALMFGMPGIPCVYYGSEWGAKANKSEGDPALRACFDAPVWNELTDEISRMAQAKKNSEALNYGAFRSVVLTNKQCIFERKSENERVLVAINADGESYTAHFDAGSANRSAITPRSIFHGNFIFFIGEPLLSVLCPGTLLTISPTNPAQCAGCSRREPAAGASS